MLSHFLKRNAGSNEVSVMLQHFVFIMAFISKDSVSLWLPLERVRSHKLNIISVNILFLVSITNLQIIVQINNFI